MVDGDRPICRSLTINHQPLTIDPGPNARTPERLKMMKRIAEIERTTAETQIRLSLSLDGTGQADVRTGVPFLDHMLTLMARHGLMDIVVEATGDLAVDLHHTVEDVGICLGM